MLRHSQHVIGISFCNVSADVGNEPRSTDCEAYAVTTTPPRRHSCAIKCPIVLCAFIFNVFVVALTGCFDYLKRASCSVVNVQIRYKMFNNFRLLALAILGHKNSTWLLKVKS